MIFQFTVDLHCDFFDCIEDLIYDAGCSDALVCSQNGKAYLEFDREADNKDQAIESALKALRDKGFNADYKATHLV
jgi:hypothetical protein